MIDLPETPTVSREWRARLLSLIEKTKRDPPSNLAAVVRDELGLDLSTRYGGIPIPHPFGKASGQLSHKLSQVQNDIESGLAFIVLKTVIAEDAESGRTMQAWTIPETRMQVERKLSVSGKAGWTISWKGRGWPGSLDEYLSFFGVALPLAKAAGVPVVPSVKYHLPDCGQPFRNDEYSHTTKKLVEVWDRVGCEGQMVLEKDFSPTLAGDRLSQSKESVLRWLSEVPRLIEQAAPKRVRLGVKLMNALFDDEFQIEMLRTLAERAKPSPAFLVVFNRLFDSASSVAYGGWDLSERNQRVLHRARLALLRLPPLSATGNICSGRVMIEYALCGCENGQLHTFFQVPLSEYTATGGSRSARALHTLILHPTQGLSVWLRHLGEAGILERRDDLLWFCDLVETAGSQVR